MERMKKIVCTGIDKHGYRCHSYLGNIEIDIPHKTDFYCRNCKRVYTYMVKSDGSIEKTVMSEKVKIQDFDSVGVVEMA